MYFEYYPSGFYWRWRLKAANHEIIASGEAYVNKSDCIHAISLVKSSAGASVYEKAA